MARPEKRLTARTVETIKKTGLHADGFGLYLHVSKTGAKSWIFRWRHDGRLRDMGLGPLNTISLAEARDKALACRKLKLDGRDPIEERRSQKRAAKLENTKVMTFEECAKAYIASHQAGWKNAKHAAQWPSTLETYVYPVMGVVPVQAVDVGLVMKVLEQNVTDNDEPPAQLWTAKPETASRVRGRIEAVLDWATARGYRQGENPARWRGHLENLLPRKTKVRRVEHHAALPYDELAEFMVELRQQNGIAARALEFAILTAACTGEVIGAKWSEIDLEGRLWTVRAERMKAGREHRAPLSEPAGAILAAMHEMRGSDFVFPGGKACHAISNMAMAMVLRRMGRSDLTVHGFRSTFRDWAAERSSFPHEVCEMALAHSVASAVERAYRRGDMFEKRRQLMDTWASFATAAAVDDEKRVVSIDRVRA